jgi:hypothetical protein
MSSYARSCARSATISVPIQATTSDQRSTTCILGSPTASNAVGREKSGRSVLRPDAHKARNRSVCRVASIADRSDSLDLAD